MDAFYEFVCCLLPAHCPERRSCCCASCNRIRTPLPSAGPFWQYRRAPWTKAASDDAVEAAATAAAAAAVAVVVAVGVGVGVGATVGDAVAAQVQAAAAVAAAAENEVAAPARVAVEVGTVEVVTVEVGIGDRSAAAATAAAAAAIGAVEAVRRGVALQDARLPPRGPGARRDPRRWTPHLARYVLEPMFFKRMLTIMIFCWDTALGLPTTTSITPKVFMSLLMISTMWASKCSSRWAGTGVDWALTVAAARSRYHMHPCGQQLQRNLRCVCWIVTTSQLSLLLLVWVWSSKQFPLS